MKWQIRFGSLLLILSLAVLISACSGAVAATTALTQAPVPTVALTQTPTAAEPPAGWEKFEGEGFEIYLPDSFAGGSSAPDLAAAAQLMRDAGNEQLAVAIETSNYLLYAIDSATAQAGTNVNIVRDDNSIIGDMSITEYANASLSYLETVSGITVLESEEIVVPGFEAWRLTESVDLLLMAGVEGTTKISQYLLKNDEHVWILSYGTSESEFEAFEPVFEMSMLTFKEK